MTTLPTKLLQTFSEIYHRVHQKIAFTMCIG